MMKKLTLFAMITIAFSQTFAQNYKTLYDFSGNYN